MGEGTKTSWERTLTASAVARGSAISASQGMRMIAPEVKMRLMRGEKRSISYKRLLLNEEVGRIRYSGAAVSFVKAVRVRYTGDSIW